MAETMSPSMSDGQIEKAVEVYRAMLRKHRSELSSEAVQWVLTQDNYVNEQVGVLRRHVEAVNEMIVRRVKVNRSRSQQEVLDATGRTQYADKEVIGLIPGKGEGEEDVDVYFFPIRKNTSVADVQVLLAQHGLRPDGYAISAVNEADPSFAERSHPNATQWVDADGKHCYVAFLQWRGGRRIVDVDRDEYDWNDRWWIGGVRK